MAVENRCLDIVVFVVSVEHGCGIVINSVVRREAVDSGFQTLEQTLNQNRLRLGYVLLLPTKRLPHCTLFFETGIRGWPVGDMIETHDNFS